MSWSVVVVTLFATWGFMSWSSRLLFPRRKRPVLASARVVKLPPARPALALEPRARCSINCPPEVFRACASEQKWRD